MLRQRDGIARGFRRSGGSVGTHDAGAVAEDGDTTHAHRGRPQVVDNLNEWLWRRAHELCEHGGQVLVGAPVESGDMLRLHGASRHGRTVRASLTVAQKRGKLALSARVAMPEPGEPT